MSSPVLKYEAAASKPFLDEVSKRSGQNLQACYQCRRCAAGCPVGEETGVTPDRLIRLIVMGDREEALNNLLVRNIICNGVSKSIIHGDRLIRINDTKKFCII